MALSKSRKTVGVSSAPFALPSKSRASRLAVFLLLAGSLAAHPMGNFSVNHYSLLELQKTGVQLTYVLDLAEIPTLELFQQWNLATPDAASLQRKAASEATTWLSNLRISVDGRQISPELTSVRTNLLDGAGGMSVLRTVMNAKALASPGELSFDDTNYATRTGWKEIVIRRSPGASIESASQSDRDLSKGLTVYPADLTMTPPQDLHASVRWAALAPAIQPLPKPAVLRAKSAAPVATPEVSPSFSAKQPAAPGTVNRGDFLSRMLREKRFGVTAILLAILVAFGLGAVHALSPGHGKTIVAAYLVGSRGTLKHALFLGLMVTFTHTVSVFLLGLGVLFFQKYVVPEQILPVLGAVSGFSIVVIGGWLLYQRSKALIHGNVHTHAAAHAHQHHDHAHEHHHPHEHTHTHGGHTHSHVVPEGKVSLGSLLALGASGGLVPCPSALILLLGAIALGHAALGLALLVGFSAGLALVLMGIGAMVLYARQLLPKGDATSGHPLFRLVPVFSSVVVIVLGLLISLTALGWVKPLPFIT
jgi:nickel/cobalt exporter